MNNSFDGKHQSNRLRPWWIGFGLLLVLSLLVNFVIEHHSHFGFEDFFGFYAGYGFGVGIILVIVAKVASIFLRRKDTYYERN